MSLFISFEGGEGTGKSTQSEILRDRIMAAGLRVTHVREPGSTALGSRIREWLKRGHPDEAPISKHAELLLFAAARAEMVAKLLLPALSQPDAVIIADRYADSTTAYQGYGRGIPLETVRSVNSAASRGVMPHLTFLLDCPPEQGLNRVGAFQMRFPLGQAAPQEPLGRDEEGTRFEEESIEFHDRVRRGYLAIAREEPERVVVIDAGRPAAEVSEAVWARVEPRLGVQQKASV